MIDILKIAQKINSNQAITPAEFCRVFERFSQYSSGPERAFLNAAIAHTSDCEKCACCGRPVAYGNYLNGESVCHVCAGWAQDVERMAA